MALLDVVILLMSLMMSNLMPEVPSAPEQMPVPLKVPLPEPFSSDVVHREGNFGKRCLYHFKDSWFFCFISCKNRFYVRY